MNIIICVDDNMGMMFNNRRQSQDRALRERILEITKGKNLYMNGYSASQFNEGSNVIVDDNFLDKAQQGDFCFVENSDIRDYNSKIEKLIIYKWNRNYPSDFKFQLTLDNFSLESTFEFQGYSHKVITEEIWKNDKT